MTNVSGLFYRSVDFLLTLLIPFILLSSAPFFSGYDVTAVFLFRVLTFVAFILYIAKVLFTDLNPKPHDERFARSAILLFSLFLVYGLIQWAGGFNVFTKWIPGTIVRYKTTSYVIQLFAYSAFFLMCLDYLRSHLRLRILINLIAFEAACLVAFGFYQKLGWMGHTGQMFGFIAMPDQANAFFSTFINANHYGGYLVLVTFLCMPTILCFIENVKKSLHSEVMLLECIFYFVLIVLMTLSMFYASARAAFLSLIIALVIFLSLASPPKQKMSIFSFVVLLGLMYVGLMKIVPFDLPLEDYLKNYIEAVHGRFMVYRDMLHAIKDYPLFGTGLGSIKYISDVYSVFYAHYFELAHILNHHIELLLTTGLVGYTLFAIPFIFYGVKCGRLMFHTSDYWTHVYGMASLVVLLIFLFPLSFLDDYLRTPTIALYFILHLCILGKCALLSPNMKGKETSFIIRENVINARHLAIFIVFFAVMISILNWTIRDWKTSRSIVFDAEDPVRLEKAAALIENNPELWLALGSAYFKEASKFNKASKFGLLAQKSRNAFKKATRLAPTWSKAWAKLGAAEMMLGNYEQGYVDLMKSIELAPHNREYYIFIMANLIRASQKSDNIYEKKYYEMETMKWFERGSMINHPITTEYINYILTVNLANPDIRLTDGDKRRLRDLLGKHAII